MIMRVFHGLMSVVAIAGTSYAVWLLWQEPSWQNLVNWITMSAAADVLIVRARGLWPDGKEASDA